MQFFTSRQRKNNPLRTTTMKKLLFTITLIFALTNVVLAQHNETPIGLSEISKINIGTLNAIYGKIINEDKSVGTVYNIKLGFKWKVNGQYAYIILDSPSQLKEFIADLKSLLPSIGQSPKMVMKERYFIGVTTTQLITLSVECKSYKGTTDITKQEAENLISWLEKIQFGQG
jgi:hypothetical protein